MHNLRIVLYSAIVSILVSAETAYSQEETAKAALPQESSEAATSSQVAPETQGELYVDEEYGFEVRGPKGWIRSAGPSGTPTRVVFAKSASPTKIMYPIFGATVDVMSKEDKFQDALEFSVALLPAYKATAEQLKASFTIVEPPRAIEVNGLKGARLVTELAGADGRAMKSIDIKFMRGNTVVTLQGADNPDTFDAHVKEFEEAVNSFRFLDKKEEPPKAPPEAAEKSWVEQILSMGRRAGGAYINQDPYFSFGIPRDVKRRWCFVEFKNTLAPFCIIDEGAAGEKETPIISATVNRIPESAVTKTKEEIYKTIVAKHEQREQEMGFQGQKFIKNGDQIDIKGLTAFERQFEVPVQGRERTYHLLYIFLDNAVLAIMLDTETKNFEQDDKDFMSIVNTLHVRSKE